VFKLVVTLKDDYVDLIVPVGGFGPSGMDREMVRYLKDGVVGPERSSDTRVFGMVAIF
jgi:hypothetical protein